MQTVRIRASLLRDLPLITAWSAAIGMLAVVARYISNEGFGWDAHVYWLAARGPLYTTGPGTLAYFYSPVFSQVIAPLTLLPWPVFAAAWSTTIAVVLALLLRPLGRRLALPLWLCCSFEIASGNVFWLFAAVAALGLRRPWLWVIPALTKVTPAVGPVWFLVRREWRQLAIALGTTVLVAAVSYLWEPQVWQDWLAFLTSHLGQTTEQVGVPGLPPLARVPLAMLVVGWGALKDRRWTIPVAMILATPVWGLNACVVLACLPVLLRESPTAATAPEVPAGCTPG